MELKYDIRQIFIHKKEQFLIHVAVCLVNEKPTVLVHETTNGIIMGDQVSSAIYMISLPKLTGNILIDAKEVWKHFRSHGFKAANTMTSTSKGIRFS